jgi:hypothetical protein
MNGLQKTEAEQEAHAYFLAQRHLQRSDRRQWKRDNHQVESHVYADGGILLVLNWPALSERGVPWCRERFALRHENRKEYDGVGDACAHQCVRDQFESSHCEDYIVEGQQGQLAEDCGECPAPGGGENQLWLMWAVGVFRQGV